MKKLKNNAKDLAIGFSFKRRQVYQFYGCGYIFFFASVRLFIEIREVAVELICACVFLGACDRKMGSMVIEDTGRKLL